MLRLCFSAEDLARVRLRDSLGPLGETVLALRALRSPPDAALLGGWRRRVAGRLPPAVVAGGGYPDLLPLVSSALTVEQGLAALRFEPQGERIAAHLMAGYDVAVAPYWPALRAYLHAEYATRARVLAEGGVARLFATLHPGVRWRAPVLELGQPSRPEPLVEHHLAGRGVDVVPSVFCRAGPQVFVPPDGGALLFVYPAVADPGATGWLWGEPSPGRTCSGRVGPASRAGQAGELGDLLGQTRAAVLAATADGCTTGELARRLRISPAGASQHATVLRRAGLILSTRRGNAVLHTVTPLGTALLGG